MILTTTPQIEGRTISESNSMLMVATSGTAVVI